MTHASGGARGPLFTPRYNCGWWGGAPHGAAERSRSAHGAGGALTELAALCRCAVMQPADGAPDEALDAAFNAELADFFVALREGKSTHMLQHLGALRAMSSAEGSSDAVWSELHGACATQAHEWVQQRVQQLVASFHVHLHEERGDLLAVDRALQEGGCLLREAQPEVGDLQVSYEVLTGCERQLLALLQAHVRRANRHELRMLYTDFCHEGRAGLRQLCLEKYKEQVAKHVQTEAVGTLLRVQAILDEESAAADGAANGQLSARVQQEVGPSLEQVFEEYVEQLGESGLLASWGCHSSAARPPRTDPPGDPPGAVRSPSRPARQ